MSSVGQAIGGIVGGAIGFIVGGPAMALRGAQLGIMAGGLIDPPKGPVINGPRLNDLAVQTATYGAFIPRAYGTVPVIGNVFWVKADKLDEVNTTTEQGGKGGPTQTTNTFSYYATFAVGLCEGPVDAVRRIWVGGQLWYDAGSDEFEAIMASNEAAEGFTLYTGSDTQQADPLIQADRGIANVPAYRGLAYIVFDSLPLEKYGNNIANTQVKVEVVCDASSASSLVRRLEVLPQNASWSVNRIASGNNYNKSGASTAIVANAGYPYLVTYFDGQVSYWRITDAQNPLHPDAVDFYTSDPDTLFPCPTAEAVVFANTTVSLDTLDYAFYSGQQYWVWGKGFATPDAFQAHTTGTSSPYAFAERAGVMYCTVLKQNTTPYLYKIGGLGAGPTGTRHIAETALSYPINASGTLAVWGDYAVLTHKLVGQSSLSVAVYNGAVLYDYFTTTVSLIGPLLVDLDCLTSSSWVEGDLLYIVHDLGKSNVNTCNLYIINLITHAVVAEYVLPFEGNGDTRQIYLGASIKVTGDVVMVMRGGTNTFGTGSGGYVFLQHAWRLSSVEPTSTTLSSIVEAECLKSGLLELADIDTTALTDTVRGYRVSQLGAIRGGIEPLRAAWPFDVVQRGYKIDFIKRGAASVATIDAGLLDAREAGTEPGVSIVDVREMDIMLPRKINIGYLDATREYDINWQPAERINTDAVNEQQTELPIVFNAEEAAQRAEMLLYLYWLERYDVAFVLPPEYQELEPSDVITISATDATYELRITSVNYLPDGRLECRARYNSATIYTSTATGEEGQSTGGSLATGGPTAYALLDVPMLTDDMDTSGFIVAMSGYSTAWPGAILYRSDDDGQTWVDVSATTTPCVMGNAINALSAHSGAVYDFSSQLTVKLLSGELASVTESALFNGQNWFAYGAHGRWEIIGARTATLQVDGSYILSDLIRGQAGTEWATGLHVAGDLVVRIGVNDAAFVGMTSATIGAARKWRGITIGKPLDSDAGLDFTYTGVNLECLSPINLTGNRHPSTNDWTLSWTRRSRHPGWRDYIDAPLGETSESYEVEIYSNSGYTTLKRTLTSSSQTVAYTSANQVTDFGSNQATLYVKVYQLSSVVGRGYALTTSITR